MTEQRFITAADVLNEADAVVAAMQAAETREEAGAAFKRQAKLVSIIENALESGGLSPETRGIVKEAQKVAVIDFMAAMIETARRMREVA